MGIIANNSPKDKRSDKWSKVCRDCGATIYFSRDIKTAEGRLRPCNEDMSRHECGNSDYARKALAVKQDLHNDQLWIGQATDYVKEVNRHLQNSTLKLTMEDRT